MTARGGLCVRPVSRSERALRSRRARSRAAGASEAGVALEVAQDVRIIVDEEGSLTTTGTASAPVSFAGVNAVATGYRTGIQIHSNSSDNDLSHTNIAHAGSSRFTGSSASYAALYLSSGATVSLTDVEIRTGGGYGVFLAAADSLLSCSNVTFTDLAEGAVRDHAASSVLPGCD